MTVLYIITSADRGGAQKHLLSLCHHLLSQRYHVVVIIGEEGPLADWLRQLGVTVYVEPLLVRHISPRRDLLSLVALWNRIRAIRPTIVHCHSSKAGIVGRLAAALARVPAVIYTAHGFVFNDPTLSRKQSRLYTWLERIGGWLSDAVVVVSHADWEAAYIKRVVARQKLHVIHNGIPVSATLHDRSGSCSPPTPVIGTVARLVKEKDISLWLRTAKLLQDTLPKACFVIVGDGPLRTDLEREATALGLNNLIWAGAQAKVEPYYRSFDLFLLTSVKEGLPTTLLEALRAGLPIVATDVGGVREIVDRQSGYVVPERDPVSLAQTVLLVLTDEQRHGEERRAHRRKRQADLFSEEQMAKQTIALYEKVARQS